MDDFLTESIVPRMTQKEVENLNISIIIQKLGKVVKDLSF